ncbi:MAG TPA: phosphatase PAP2 family protein [Bacteroidetes bacterium]|nr:phosphatase PAP2 family protein [Bacteroidota bacterium]
MSQIFKQKNIFFWLSALLFASGGIYLFFYKKPELILFFNENRSAVGDLFFRYVTKMGEGTVYVVSGLVFLAIRLRHALLVMLTAAVVAGLSFALKAAFAIDRPIAYFRKMGRLDEINFVDGVDQLSGATSFPSGHSMSAFAIYGLLVLLLPNKKRYAFPLLVTAALVALSRVYLVQHFFVDIYAGGFIGLSVAVVLYAIDQRVRFREGHFMDRPLLK